MTFQEYRKATRGRTCLVTVSGTEHWVVISRVQAKELWHSLKGGLVVDTSYEGQAYIEAKDEE